jgi:hypothetical protein
MMGGTSWCHGQVSELRRSSARSGEIIIDLGVRDQAGQATALGRAVVELPLRSADGTR